MMQQPFRAIDLARYLICRPFFIMLFLMLIEAALHAVTTYLVIQAGRDVAQGKFLLADLLWILASESIAYIVGALSWIFAERTGFLAYARYTMRFARDNRAKTKLLGDKEARERVEPFLTGETFYVYFHLLYEIEGDLRILLALVLNVIVLGSEIDGALPVAYAAVFVVLFLMQWTMRRRVATAYRENQRMTNRMTAQGYTAWDNVFAGNRYNLRLWIDGFKRKLRDGLDAQIKAIMTKEGLSAASGIIGLAIVFAAMAFVAWKDSSNLEDDDRARRDPAAPDRDDQGRSHLHVGLERSLGAMGAAHGRRRQLSPPTRSGVRWPLEDRAADAPRARQRDPGGRNR